MKNNFSNRNNNTLGYSIKNDVIFKELFSKIGNECFLHEFLENILNIKINKLKIVKDAALTREIVSGKYGILDIKVTVNDDTLINIEMQNIDNRNMIKRMMYYSSKLISSQLFSGDDYSKLKNVISIAILNYNLSEISLQNYLNESIIVSKNNRFNKITDMQRLIIIELPKFRKSTISLDNKIEQWLLFLDGTDERRIKEVMERNTLIKKAHQESCYLTGRERKRRLAELREKYELDLNSLKAYARDEGIQEGLIEGVQKGIEKGTKKEKITTAKMMLKENLSVSLISKITGLDINKINSLKENKDTNMVY